MFGADDKITIIAEVASAHEGDPERAIALARAAAESGVDAVKFQLFKADDLVVAHHPKVAAFQEIELSPEAWTTVIRAAKDTGLKVIADVYDLSSCELAQHLEVSGYKLTTTSAGDKELFARVAQAQAPIIMAVGCESKEEILALLDVFTSDQIAHSLVLMHGFQGFPTQLQDIHLRRLEWLKNEFSLPIGFADHYPAADPFAVALPVVAVGMGARVIEKHITLDRSAKGRDYISALNPDEFIRMVHWIRAVEPCLGALTPKHPEAELKYREAMQKKVVAKSPMPVGARISKEDIVYKRSPDAGMGPESLSDILGHRLIEAVQADQSFLPAKLIKPKTLILVAVRMKSTRLPKKALHCIKGKPVLAHLVERLAKVSHAQGLILCTSTHSEDTILLEWADRLGIRGYAGDEDDVMARFLSVAEQEGADVIVRVTGDNPLTDPEALDAMILFHRERGADYTYTEDLPRGTRAEIISVQALRRAHELAEDPTHSEYMTLYFKQHPEIFSLSRWDAPQAVTRPGYRLTLDTPEDLDLVTRIYEALYEDGKPFRLKEAIQLLDQQPEWVKINAHIQPKVPSTILR